MVNVASILGVVGFETAPAYTAAKHGLLGLTKVAAMERAPKGIRINAVCPGFIETPMVMDRGVAAAILWLASDEASFVVGHALVVDGAYTAR